MSADWHLEVDFDPETEPKRHSENEPHYFRKENRWLGCDRDRMQTLPRNVDEEIDILEFCIHIVVQFM